MPGGLLTDLYELNMAASYLRRDMHELATFSLYVRGLPPTRGFLVAAGLQPCLDFLESFSFTGEELETLGAFGFDDQALADFEGVSFDGEVWAIPEGHVVYSEEPLLEVTASLAVAQIVETYLLNQITLHTTMASKAARYVIAAQGRGLVDFAFRRTHGTEAAMAVARASAMVGFSATSNVEAARRHDLPVAGTMAHSFVEAFGSEREAFMAFARDHPERATFLVDTYDTITGVAAAIDVIDALGLREHIGVRLDSGDLDSLSRSARSMLDVAGLPDAQVFASGGLDEHEVDGLVTADAPIDAFGIGTQLGVSADAPSVDSVYKLTEYGGRPTLKLSAGKVSAPGRKQVWRTDDDGFHRDTLCLREEPAPGSAEPMLTRVMGAGRRLDPPPPLSTALDRFRSDLEHVPVGARRLAEPEHVEVAHSSALVELTRETTDLVLRQGANG